MASKGFISSAASFIRQIRQNLGEGGYTFGESGFSIIKELVQNADDAGANVMHIGISDPLPGLKHPLLQGPALFVINDGPFQPVDAENIRRFGENSKSMDTAQIGKFGLGLKSIFHLCEAFFFFGTHEVDGRSETVADILNPWSGEHGDEFHDGWDNFNEQDQRQLLKALRPFLGGRACFSLWVPLRQKSHLVGNDPIKPFYPGDESLGWLEQPELPVEISKLLPMLRQLQSVTLWSLTGKHRLLGLGTWKTQPSHVAQIGLRESSERQRDFDSLELKQPHEMQGGVLITHESNPNAEIGFVGLEWNPGAEGLSQLQKNPHWPRDLGRDPASGRATNVPEKANPHAGVCCSFHRCPQNRDGKLSLSWAVFLPLGEPDVELLPGCPFNLSLLLHGYFFVDAGRNQPIRLSQGRAPFSEPKNDEQLREVWNDRLATRGTFPLLLRVLDRLQTTENAAILRPYLGRITSALEATNVVRRFREEICRENSWAEVLTPGRGHQWVLMESSEPLLELPTTTDPARPWKVFPALETVCTESRLTLKGTPRLVSSRINTAWPEDALDQLLASVVPEELWQSDASTNYLVRFLDQLSDEDTRVASHTRLVAILRSGLSTLDSAGLDESSGIGQLVRRIPSRYRIPVSISEPFRDEVIRELNRHELPYLFLPSQLDPSDISGAARLSAAEAETLLTSLATRLQSINETGERNAISQVAAQLIHRLAVDETTTEIEVLELFHVENLKESNHVLTDWNTLRLHQRAGLLFVKPSPNAASLQRALADVTVLRIETDIYATLFPSESRTPQCNAPEMIRVLASNSPPRLKDATERSRTVEYLLTRGAETRQKESYRQAVRYLLHGEQSQAASNLPLLSAVTGQSDIWRRITNTSLRQQHSHWRLIDSELAGFLRDRDREELNVQTVGSTSAAILITEIGATHFQDLKPSEDEYTELLRLLDDNALLRALPIHQTITDDFGAFGPDCYWESELQLPEGIETSVTLLRRSQNASTWQRQQELGPSLTAEAVMCIVLDSETPGQHWELILNFLEEVARPSAECLNRVRHVPWLPIRAGESVAPATFVNLPQIADDVARFLSREQNGFHEPGQLEDAVRAHPGYPRLVKLAFPDESKAVGMLGNLLSDDAANQLGRLPESVFGAWAKIAGLIPVELLPCGPLVAQVAQHDPGHAKVLFTCLTVSDLMPERYGDFIDFCRRTHQEQQNPQIRDALLDVFNAYLRLAIQEDGYGNVLGREHLLSRAGDWAAAEMLSCSNDGIIQPSVVHPKTEEVLQPFFPAILQSDEHNGRPRNDDLGVEPPHELKEEQVAQASKVLNSYFHSWEDIVPNEQIGGFLTLLGSADVELAALAQRYLTKNRTIEQTQINFRLPDTVVGQGMEDGPTMMSKQRVFVETVESPSVRVLNLLGKPIEALRNTTPATIFVGYGKMNIFPSRHHNGHRVRCFRLNVVDPRQYTQGDLSRLLRDSAVRFMTEAYNCLEHQTDFATTWEALSESDQIDICIAQERLIENGFLLLSQLGVRSNQRLREPLDRWDAAQKREAERNVGSGKPALASQSDVLEERTKAKTALRRLLESDTSVQADILTAIRGRIAGHYQYTKSSVPFEIFQNADDASLELVKYFEPSEDARRKAGVFHLRISEKHITFAHMGRRINQYPLQSVDTPSGFDDDLWKMLVLSLSNKGQGENAGSQVTGKFGLGFKSCYLAADKPRLLSGRLAFEVTGGMYPRRLIAEERDSLDGFRKEELGDDFQSTIVELPLTKAGEDEVLTTFLEVAHVLVVFSKQIKTCLLNQGEGEATWSPQAVTGIEGAEYGRISSMQSEKYGPKSVHSVLHLKSDNGSLLIAVGARGFDRLPEFLPSVWVTAPTREKLDLGFLINGPFALDVGRAQLARDIDENRDIAGRLGVSLAMQLRRLFELSRSKDGWRQLCGELGLEDNASPYEFSNSLFKLIALDLSKKASDEDPATQVILEVFWNGRDQAAQSLYRQHPVTPSRLEGNYKGLVYANRIRYVLADHLAEDSKLFARVSDWDSFQRKAPPGSMVSEAEVYRPMRRLNAIAEASCERVILETAIGWELGEGSCAGQESAERLGTVVNKELLSKLTSTAEGTKLRDFLKAVQFQAADGHYYPAGRLIVGHRVGRHEDDVSVEERARARFAPDGRVLNESYGRAAVEFFDACRGSARPSPRDLAEWIIDASTKKPQIAALEYLANGQFARAVLDELKQRGLEQTWLAPTSLRQSAVFRALDDRTKDRLSGLLVEGEGSFIDWNDFFRRNQTPERRIVEEKLQYIHDWWLRERDRPQPQFDNRSWIAEYERRTYLDGPPAALNADDPEDEAAEREAWMTLFLLGLTHIMGRTTPDQHRGFLRECRDNGWLELFATPHSHTSGALDTQWMDFLRGYFDRQSEEVMYFHWLRQFAGIFQISRQLDDYRELFLAIDRMNQSFGLVEVLRSKVSHLFQGGGLDAPPISRVLGLGACFVTRELVRLGVLKSDLAHPHCFVPTRRVRNLFVFWGCEGLERESRKWELSPLIHRFIADRLGPDQATFGGDFDIPFLFIAGDSGLKRRFDLDDVEWYQLDADDDLAL